MKSLGQCIRSDGGRFLHQPFWLIAVIGVAVSLQVASRVNHGYGVIFQLEFAAQMTPAIFTYIFCALAFSQTIAEDLENRYVRYYLIRESRTRYVASKTWIIFAGAMLCMMAGTVVFVLVCRVRMPWIEQISIEEGFEGAYVSLLRNGHCFLYCVLYSFHLGLLAGILSVISAFMSLFVRNKVMTLALPALLYCILGQIEICGVGINALLPTFPRISNDILNLLACLAVTAGVVSVLAAGMYARLAKWL